MTPTELLSVANFGRKSLVEIESRLALIGLRLNIDEGQQDGGQDDAPILPDCKTVPATTSTLESARSQVVRMITRFGGLPGLAYALEVRPSSLQKILDEKPISYLTRQRIKRHMNAILDRPMREAKSVSARLKPDKILKLLELHKLYDSGKTLQQIGDQISLTRERVRQMLSYGDRLGLFSYRPHEIDIIPKEKLLADYKKLRNLLNVAAQNGISGPALQKMLRHWKITRSDLNAIRRTYLRERCIGQFQEYSQALGHSPTTTELQAEQAGRYLNMKIVRLWGSIDKFREELNIPKPPQGNPNFAAVARATSARRSRLARIIRMQHLDEIRDALSKQDNLTLQEIAIRTGLKLVRTDNLLRLLIASKEVVAESSVKPYRYRLTIES